MSSGLRSKLKNAFGFSQTEINGFFVLVGILVLTIIAPFFFGNSGAYAHFTSDRAILDSIVHSFEKQVLKEEIIQNSESNENDENSIAPAIIHYHPFDPNHTTTTSWMSLGVSEKISNRIDHYLEKGGKFSQKSDLLKIYGFPKETYNKLEPYITLPEQKPATFETNNKTFDHHKENPEVNPTNSYKSYHQTEISVFEINTCNKEQLTQIHGIGEKLSERILKFRDGLGGFYSKEQFEDIYGLDSSVIESLKNYSTLDITKIQTIDLNTVTAEELKKHPYISYKLGDVIINYRTQHGPFSEFNDLQNIYLLKGKEDLLAKLEPYLAIK